MARTRSYHNRGQVAAHLGPFPALWRAYGRADTPTRTRVASLVSAYQYGQMDGAELSRQVGAALGITIASDGR